MTSGDLVFDSIRLIGALGAAEPADPLDTALGHRTLRRMIGDWANQGLSKYASARSVFNLTSGQQTYTYGPGGNWNAPRPAQINAWSVIPDRNIADRIEIPRGRPLSLEQWQRIGIKTTLSTFPSDIYFDNSISSTGQTIATVCPVPDNSLAAVVLYVPISIPEFVAAYNVDVVLPPGYEQAILTNLAVLLAPFFSGSVVSEDVKQQARSSLDNLKSMNWREPELPKGAPWEHGHDYNIYTDEYSR